MAIRKSATNRDIEIKIDSIAGVGASNSQTEKGILVLIKNPTLTGTALTWNNSTNGRYQYALNTSTTQMATLNTGRSLISLPMAGGGSYKDLTNDYLTWLSEGIDGTADIFALIYIPTTSNQSLCGIMNLQEF